MTRMTHDQFVATGLERFGANPLDWAFRCPSCGDVATGHDFAAALAEHPHERNGRPTTAIDHLGQVCIGRILGALTRGVEYTGRGCDWTAFGLFHGPLFVERDGREVPSFEFAEVAP